mgnify:FL=1
MEVQVNWRRNQREPVFELMSSSISRTVLGFNENEDLSGTQQGGTGLQIGNEIVGCF